MKSQFTFLLVALLLASTVNSTYTPTQLHCDTTPNAESQAEIILTETQVDSSTNEATLEQITLKINETSYKIYALIEQNGGSKVIREFLITDSGVVTQTDAEFTNDVISFKAHKTAGLFAITSDDDITYNLANFALDGEILGTTKTQNQLSTPGDAVIVQIDSNGNAVIDMGTYLQQFNAADATAVTSSDQLTQDGDFQCRSDYCFDNGNGIIIDVDDMSSLATFDFNLIPVGTPQFFYSQKLLAFLDVSEELASMTYLNLAGDTALNVPENYTFTNSIKQFHTHSISQGSGFGVALYDGAELKIFSTVNSDDDQQQELHFSSTSDLMVQTADKIESISMYALIHVLTSEKIFVVDYVDSDIDSSVKTTLGSVNFYNITSPNIDTQTTLRQSALQSGIKSELQLQKPSDLFAVFSVECECINSEARTLLCFDNSVCVTSIVSKAGNCDEQYTPIVVPTVSS